MARDDEKRRAAEAALSHVTDGMVLGVGTGSTVDVFIELLVKKMMEEELEITTVPSSYGTEHRLRAAGFEIEGLSEVSSVPLAVDGADEVDPQLALIKGGGAALFREKILAEAAIQVVIIVDSSKVVSQLGEKMPVPVEIHPAALTLGMARIHQLGGVSVIRQAKKKAGPVITDNGNFILDVTFDQIINPEQLEMQLNAIPGVLENGIFPDQADIVYVGEAKGIRQMQR